MNHADQDNFTGVALITGASSGIGLELARLFAADGHSLVLIGRSVDALRDLADELSNAHGISVTCIGKDLFQPNAAQELYLEVQARELQIDYLVNDAGQGVYGRFVDTDLPQELDIIHLNVTVPMVLTKLFLREMIARGHGRILQVASMVSVAPSPLMAVYAGTKAFLYNFTESLIDEIKGTGVTMTALRPGATDTDFFNKAGAQDASMVQNDMLGSPVPVAKAGYAALMRGDDSVVPGVLNKLQDAAAQVLPKPMVAKAMGKMNAPKHQDGR